MMTDEEIDALIDKLKPDLRIAFRSVLSGDTTHAFNIGAVEETTGERQEDALTLFITNRFMGDVLMAVNSGIENATNKQVERMKERLKLRQMQAILQGAGRGVRTGNA